MAAVAVEKTLPHTMDDNSAIDHLCESAGPIKRKLQSARKTKNQRRAGAFIDQKKRERNLREREREDDIQRRGGSARERGRGDDDDEVNQPDERLHHGGDQVQGRFQFARSEEGDFQQGQDNG